MQHTPPLKRRASRCRKPRAYNARQGQWSVTHSLLLAALLLMPVWLFGMQLYQSVNSAEQVRGVVEATNQS